MIEKPENDGGKSGDNPEFTAFFYKQY